MIEYCEELNKILIDHFTYNNIDTILNNSKIVYTRIIFRFKNRLDEFKSFKTSIILNGINDGYIFVLPISKCDDRCEMIFTSQNKKEISRLLKLRAFY